MYFLIFLTNKRFYLFLLFILIVLNAQNSSLNQERPDDPVEYLSNFLRRYGKDKKGQRAESPEYEDGDIAQAADAATVTTMALHHHHGGLSLEQVEEQTEEPTTDDAATENYENSEAPLNEESSDELPAPADPDEAEAEAGGEGDIEGSEETSAPAGETATEDMDAEGPEGDGEAEGQTGETELDGEEDDDIETLKGVTRLEEQKAKMEKAAVVDEDSIQVHDEREEEVPGGGQRDERGQSVLHFAAARPGGSQTLLAFLQNPTVSLGWRDERGKTARDVASTLHRSENVQTIDSYIVSRAAAGDLQTLEKLLLDGYDHIIDAEDSNRVSIMDIAEKTGHQAVLQFLKGIPQFRENLERLMASIRMGDLDRCKEILQEDPRLAVAMGTNGRTALHVAVLCEEYPIVQYIAQQFPESLRRGDNLERTALHYAMGIEKVEKMTRILVRMGAKRVLKDISGKQPSYYFINRSEIARLQEQEKS